jgi:ribonuclease P protein component
VKRNYRLTRSTDFKRVRRLGKSFAHPLVVLVVLPDHVEQTRIGIAAGRSVGNAVKRNYAKRRLRAVLQPYHRSLAPGRKVVLLARQPIQAAEYDEIDNAVRGLLIRAGLLDKSERTNEPIAS